MNTCPRCKAPLLPAVYEWLTVQTCSDCHGHWLDREQLKAIVDTRDRTWDRDALAAAREARRRPLLKAVRENLPCPSCGRAMQAFNYGADTGIILDKCDHCGGIWLDGGELEKVQIAVEAADEALTADLKRFAGRLHEEEVRQDAKELEANRSSRAPLVVAFVNQILDEDHPAKG
jgi:uncharacterized protein